MSAAPSLLDAIQSPADLRLLARAQLAQLATELRAFLVDTVSHTGGHLSSNLGTVELAIALHYVFNTPEDRLVWDVGHQSYAHKILTGRREGMARLRMKGGVSGFPRRDESPYDTFGVGHSSTSISAALGMALAAKRKGETRKVVAIIGDGAMSAGMAFEALNNAGVADADMLVILNDNEMSISPPVGALNNMLTRLMSGKTFNAARKVGRHMLGVAPPLLELARRAEEHVKGMITPGALFEEFGFHYYGPIDGHDFNALAPTLDNIKQLKGPQFLHVITRKGQGYAQAEANPILYHGVGKFDAETGIAENPPATTGKTPAKTTYTQVFGDWLCDMAAVDERLVGITPAMREGSGLVAFAERFPDRYYDVGIAEQHAVTFAAGLATEGLKPVVAIYSTFLQRAYDQLIHDVALQNLPVLFAIDRSGLVGADGATHHGAFDLSFLNCVPNLTIMAPANLAECRRMLTTGFGIDGPAAIRYPRGGDVKTLPDADLSPLPIGRGIVLREGREVVLLAVGSMVAPALAAGERLKASVVNLRFIKPLDIELIRRMVETHALIVTLEENAVIGGVGIEIARRLAEDGLFPACLHLGLPDRFIDHGEQDELLAELGLDADGIVESVLKTHKTLPPPDKKT
jgi:1-deoxy-D-xylulose-5-phosphate synthase